VDVPSDAIVEVDTTGPDRFLEPNERAALTVFHQRRQFSLSPDTQAKLFSLFLNGVNCLEIVRLNRGISLGQVIAARVEGRWDEKRQQHVEDLLKETRQRIQQTTLESVDFVASQLAAAHKLYGDKVKKFLQTGDEADLGGFSISGWKTYREALELLKLVTGQDTKKVQGEVKHTHTHEVAQPLTPVNRPMTGDEARLARKAFLSKGK
jgi:hypothetical protein